ncbi:MAG: 50S ribosomal protein L6 [Bacilli bacterium]|jgi:large subunit ribosomal protein L6
MSRIGKRTLIIPEQVMVLLNQDKVIVKGPKGELSLHLPKEIIVKKEDNNLTVTIKEEQKQLKAIHGTINSLIKNMIDGVYTGFSKGLEIVGVGYRFQVKDQVIVINAGFSHPLEIKIPNSLTVESISNTEIIIKGINKEEVGEFAAKIRKVRKPEPYKGKGIRYKGEVIRHKEGKKAS